MTVTLTAPGAGRRADAIRGLANLAAFIETHPSLPLAGERSEEPFSLYVSAGTDTENRAEVDRIAGILGTAPQWLYGSSACYAAVRHFGGGVTYRALAAGSRYKPGEARTAAGSRAAA